MREYKFRGYKFRATNTQVEVLVPRFDIERKELRPLYEIDGLKEATKKPYLTSINDCKGYIDYFRYMVERNRKEATRNAENVSGQNL